MPAHRQSAATAKASEEAAKASEAVAEAEEKDTEINRETSDIIEKIIGADDGNFDSSIDALLNSMVNGRATMILNAVGSPIVSRGIRGKGGKRGFAFCDSVADAYTVIIPYTRAQYLALPRKKKKSVLMSVKKLLRYSAIKSLCDALRSLNSKNERILSRIEKLEERLHTEEKLLPTAKLWENAVKRLKR